MHRAVYIHLCYAGISGATRQAINIAAGSGDPGRHGYVLYGVAQPHAQYIAELSQLGCPWQYVPKRPGLDLRGYHRAAAALGAMAPRVIVLHGLRTLPVAVLTRAMAWDVPLLGVHHGPADELLTPRGKAAAAALALCCRRTVAVSAELARRLAAVHVRATVIPGTVNTDFWRCGGAGPSRAGTICMVGSLEPSKDHPTLLEAVALLRQRGLNVRLRLVGEGSRRDELQRLTRELGIAEQVAFVGELDASSVREELCSAAAVAHITRSEGLSLSVMEAMAAGKAIVASDVAGVRELIEHERTGLLAACGDAQALAVLLGRVVSDRDLALRLGMAASQAAAGGGVGELSANYVRILTALADGFF